MVEPQVLVTKQDLIELLTASGKGAGESTFQRLRREGLLSPGISRAGDRRGPGHIHGRVQLYCSLNREAARLAVQGDEAGARRLADTAQRIEQDVEQAPDLVAFLAELASGAVTDAWTTPLVRRITALVRDMRAARTEVTPTWNYWCGIVTRLEGAQATVETTQGTLLAMQRIVLQDRSLDRPGAPIEVCVEHVYPGYTLTRVSSALDVPAAPEPRSGGMFAPSRYVASEDEFELLSSLLDAPATITPIPIESAPS